jgi:NADH-quinone oxidoreductase subunit I
MKNLVSEVYFGLKSLFIGMGITLGEFFKPAITVRYPYETLKISPRFRGHIELVRDPATGQPKCFVCKLCEKACPSDCITVEGIKPEGARRKTVTSYRLDFTKCSLCGSCVEACRDGAIRFSREYNLAGTRKEDFIMDLFQRLEAQRLQDEKSAGRDGSVTNLSVPPSGQPKPAEPSGSAPTQPTAALHKASQTTVEVK